MTSLGRSDCSKPRAPPWRLKRTSAVPTLRGYKENERRRTVEVESHWKEVVDALRIVDGMAFTTMVPDSGMRCTSTAMLFSRPRYMTSGTMTVIVRSGTKRTRNESRVLRLAGANRQPT
jgi:hypothetical protein